MAIHEGGMTGSVQDREKGSRKAQLYQSGGI